MRGNTSSAPAVRAVPSMAAMTSEARRAPAGADASAASASASAVRAMPCSASSPGWRALTYRSLASSQRAPHPAASRGSATDQGQLSRAITPTRASAGSCRASRSAACAPGFGAATSAPEWDTERIQPCVRGVPATSRLGAPCAHTTSRDSLQYGT